MTRHGHGPEFWGLILPHGLLELTAVFVAGGVGLRLFWSWVEPGDLSRGPVLRPRGPHGRAPSPSGWSASSPSAAASRRS